MTFWHQLIGVALIFPFASVAATALWRSFANRVDGFLKEATE